MAKTGADNVFIDVTHLPHNLVTTRFPNIYQFCLDYGLDITKEMVPVAPALQTPSMNHIQLRGLS